MLVYCVSPLSWIDINSLTMPYARIDGVGYGSWEEMEGIDTIGYGCCEEMEGVGEGKRQFP